MKQNNVAAPVSGLDVQGAINAEIRQIQRSFESLGVINDVTAEKLLRPAFERVAALIRTALEEQRTHCCGDAHADLESALSHIRLIGFEEEIIESKNAIEHIWHNRRAEKSESETRQLQEALEKITSYNRDIRDGKINYRAEDHIAVAERVLAGGKSA